MEVLIIAFVVAAALGVFLVVRNKRADAEAARAPYKVSPERPRNFPVASPEGPKPRKPVAADQPFGPDLTIDGDFIEMGSAEDPVGDPVLARKVSIGRSTQRLLPDNKLFQPGDVVTLAAAIVDENSQPLADVPVVWVRRIGYKRLAGPVRTDASGSAAAKYTVQPDDMVGDPATPEPDSGSYIVDCYAGGRRLIKTTILHDVA